MGIWHRRSIRLSHMRRQRGTSRGDGFDYGGSLIDVRVTVIPLSAAQAIKKMRTREKVEGNEEPSMDSSCT